MTDEQRLRVLDLTDDLALGAGRLFVGMGADVVRIEADTHHGRTDTAALLHWRPGTRVVTTAARDVPGVINRLLPRADVVIESGPRESLRTVDMRAADPDRWAPVVHVVVTPFGLTGPRAGWTADDTVASAAGGMAWLGGFPAREPQPAPREQALQLAGSHAVIAAQLALLARERTGRGQLAEISVQEAVAGTLETGAIAWIHGRKVPGRTGGVYDHVAARVFATRDGFVAGGWSGPDRMWTDLLAWLVEEGAADDLVEDVWKDPTHRWNERAHIDEVVAAFVRERTTSEIAEQGRQRALPWAAVARPHDLIENPQLLSRDYFVHFSRGPRDLWDVGFPYPSPRRPRELGPPVAIEDGRWVSASGTPPPDARHWRGWSERGERSPARALDGLRVLDLTWVLAGPYMTKLLAEHGADVVKIESRHRQDPTRFSPSMRLRPGAGPDESGYFINFNRNKRSLALNLRTADGVRLLRDLAARADVVVENFAPGVLARWGLDYPNLRDLNPDVLLVSMAGVGATGPWRQAVTFADTLAAMSGLTFETGDDETPPYGLTFGLGDMVAANAAVMATLDYLSTGSGGHADLSQLEAMAAHLGTLALDQQLDRSRRPGMGPYVLPAPGDDRWLAVGRVDRVVLARAMGLPESTPSDVIEHSLRERSRSVLAETLADHLQAAGVAAYPVRNGRDLVEDDPQLAARGFYLDQAHPLAGGIKVEGIVEHLTGTPGTIDRPAPLLGEHTDQLLAEVLDLTTDEIADLHEQGVLE